jgi:hypothetical protein
MKPAKIYTFTIPANGSFPLLAQGDFFKVQSATGAFELIGDSFGTLGGLLPGQGMEDTPFSRLTFRDTSGGLNTLSVLIAGSKFIDDRVTGTVEVIDSAVSKTLSGQGFAWTNFTAAVAAQYAYAQLWNPVGSGKRVRVDAAVVSASIGTQNYGYVTNVQAALAASQANGHNKLAGGANSVSMGRYDSSATDFGAGQKYQWFIDVMAASASYVDLRYPVILLPGYGLSMKNSSFNGNMNVSVEFVEETL